MSIFEDLSELSWGAWIRSLLTAGISSAASVVAANPLAVAMGTPEFTPKQLAILALAAAIVAMAGVLQKSPLPDRKLAIALLPGVHTPEQVERISKATGSGVPTKEVAAAIIAGDKSKPAEPPA